MQPIMIAQLEEHHDYVYEVKYDGFRVLLYWEDKHVKITSRKGVDLTKQFPEIVTICNELFQDVKEYLPCVLDGELVLLNNPLQGNFYELQTRGRLKNNGKINESASKRPATFMVFDLLKIKNESILAKSLTMRKKQLQNLFTHIDHPLLRQVAVYSSYAELKHMVFDYQAEGIVAKRKKSVYTIGKKHHDWVKEKNWRRFTGFLTAYHAENEYFDVGVYDHGKMKRIGQCKHGLNDESLTVLRHLFLSEGTKQGTKYTLPPAICARINTLGTEHGELREAQFEKLESEMDADSCTFEKLKADVAMLPDEVSISNEDKLFWPVEQITKLDHIIYMRAIYPLMKSYLENRALTIIRCPDGINESCFFQKNTPDYAPGFVHTSNDKQIVCDQLNTLVWLANHGAIEYHIPFERLGEKYPDSIVFDLDPPSRKEFPMAVEAAQLFKRLFDELELVTFIKTSGNKGLQIHLPLPFGMFSYNDTAIFTENLATIVTESAPELCTTERFKQNRNGRMYIDYVQHGKNKTIIAPYSPRKIPTAAVATPLEWHEVDNDLSPDDFTIKTVLNRITTKGCPWMFHYERARTQSFEKAAPLFKEN